MSLVLWIVLCFLCPPAVVAFSPKNGAEEDESVPGCVCFGRTLFFSISLCLTCCLWIPGVLFSLYLVYVNKEVMRGNGCSFCGDDDV